MTNQLVQIALEISEKRRQILMRIRQAIVHNDKETVFSLAKKLTGLTDEERTGIGSRLN